MSCSTCNGNILFNYLIGAHVPGLGVRAEQRMRLGREPGQGPGEELVSQEAGNALQVDGEVIVVRTQEVQEQLPKEIIVQLAGSINETLFILTAGV